MEVPEWLEADDPYDYPEDFDAVENEEEEDSSLDLDQEDPQTEPDEYADLLMGERAKTKQQKRIPVRSEFNLRAEDTASLSFHLQKNIEGEVYRCLFLVMVNDSIKHKYFLDRKVQGDFEISDLRKLGITATQQWNEQPEVLSDEEFKSRFNEYLENFKVSEFPVRSYCWDKDKDFLLQYLDTSSKVEKPKTIEFLMKTEYQFSDEQTKRSYLLSEFKVKGIKDDMFEEIVKDFELIISIF